MVARLALVALAYVVTARLGLRLASVGQTITLVWAPAGIAIVALRRYGIRA